MEIGSLFASLSAFDLLVFLGLFAFFILGFIQGTIRRLLGIASILFSLLFAMQARGPLGNFLVENWTYYPEEYSRMIGVGAVFVAGSLAFTVALQFFYKVVPLFVRFPAVDEILGGMLGILQGLLILTAVIMIMDPFYQLPGVPEFRDEWLALRTIHQALDQAAIVGFMRDAVIPGFLALFGALIPADVTVVFPG